LESNGDIEMIYQLSEEYYVRNLRETDLAGPYPSWFEDQDVSQHNSHGKFFKSNSEFQNYVKLSSGSEQIVWAICHIQDGHIGNVVLHEISFINRNADFAILVGDRRHWAKGVGYLVSKTLFEHAFQKLNLHKIYCATAQTNAAMINLAKKLSMIEEGRWREHVYLNGKYVDLIAFGVLKDEFMNNLESK